MKKIILLSLLLGLLSCNSKKEFTRELLLGEWHVEYNDNYGDEVIARYCGDNYGCVAIIFDADGTFSQKLGNDKLGKWQVEGGGKNKQLVLIYNDGHRLKTEFDRFEYINDGFCRGKLKMFLSAAEEEEKYIPIYRN